MLLELGNTTVLGRVKVPSDSYYIALLRLADSEGFVNYFCLESKPSSATISGQDTSVATNYVNSDGEVRWKRMRFTKESEQK